MTEAELNRIISSSIARNGWSHKISDAAQGKGGLLPFDGFGIFKPGEADGVPIYWDAQNLKKPEAFNFNDLQNHQIDNLRAISHLCKAAVPLFLVCVDYGRMNKKVFVFKDMDYIFQRKVDKKSILKKEFDKRRNFVLIRKDKIDFNEILAMPREWEYEEVENK